MRSLKEKGCKRCVKKLQHFQAFLLLDGNSCHTAKRRLSKRVKMVMMMMMMMMMMMTMMMILAGLIFRLQPARREALHSTQQSFSAVRTIPHHH